MRDHKVRDCEGLLNAEVPSHAGPWRNYSVPGGEEQHVVPGFEGRRHVLHVLCWCHPTTQLEEDGYRVMHNAAQ